MTDFIRIRYTGRADGRVFDTTEKDVAQKEGVLSEHIAYKPLPVLLGEGTLIKGMETALTSMKVGEEKTIKIKPAEAYGERNENMIKLVPLKVFQQQKIAPTPGMVFSLDGSRARVLSVSSGRVRLDFNHELAGKELEFWIKIDSKAKTEKEIIDFLTDITFPMIDGIKVEKKEKEVHVTLPEMVKQLKDLEIRKRMFTDMAKKHLNVERVLFTESM